jgi:hypothetical protein
VDERHAPALGGVPADVAGEPVVGVDQVVVAAVVSGPGLPHAVREGAQVCGQVLLGQALVGSGGHVPYQDTGREFDAGRERGGGGPGEDLHLDVDGGEALGELDDVDVHPAGVAGAGLVQR